MTIPVQPTGGPKENLRTMQTLIAVLLMGITIFTGIVLFLLSVNGPFLEPVNLLFNKILFYVVISLALGCYFFARTLYNKKVETVYHSTNLLAGKLNQYRTLLILYMACCEGPALFSVVALLLTGNYWLLIVTISMMMAMAVKFPFSQKVISLLNINWKEQQDLL